MSLRGVSAAVAALGLAIAAYLTIVRYSGGEPVCAIAHGCSVVQSSRYAALAGVPVALLGLVAYVALLAALAFDLRSVTALVALTGAGFSSWLTYVEVAILEAICAWCVASAVCMAVLAATSVVRLLRE